LLQLWLQPQLPGLCSLQWWQLLLPLLLLLLLLQQKLLHSLAPPPLCSQLQLQLPAHQLLPLQLPLLALRLHLRLPLQLPLQQPYQLLSLLLRQLRSYLPLLFLLQLLPHYQMQFCQQQLSLPQQRKLHHMLAEVAVREL
jgi:hypothetical protein